MDKNFKITVIVATYNPLWHKLKSTLYSIIVQKNIDFEIIITDDGSQTDYFEKAEAFLKNNFFTNYRFLKNPVNIGTVNNFYSALKKSIGEFVFATSPGDMLYDENTLLDLYNFAKHKDADISFGDAVYYSNDNNDWQILNNYKNAPINNDLFNEDKPFALQKIGFFFGNSILGAAFFRKRESAVKYIETIKDVCKYVEDNTSTAFALADNVRIYHLKRYVVWYEYGTGVSTNKNKKWKDLLKKDFEQSFKRLNEANPDDVIINNVYRLRKIDNKFLKAIYLLFKNPILLFNILKIKMMKKSIGPLHEVNKNIFINYIKIGSDI